MKRFLLFFMAFSLFLVMQFSGCEKQKALSSIDNFYQLAENNVLLAKEAPNYEYQFRQSGVVFTTTAQNTNPEYVCEWEVKEIGGKSYVYLYYGEFDTQKFLLECTPNEATFTNEYGMNLGVNGLSSRILTFRKK